MICTLPLYRIPIGSNNWYRLTPYDQSKLRNHGVILPYEALLSYESDPMWDRDSVQILPCGQCINCRLNRSRDWAVRCSLEAEQHEFNYFVTLTYDDFSLPKGFFIDYNGDLFDSNLCRRHVQLFLKKLREWERTEKFNTGIKVFYCGEYGGLTSRPHYHLCLFGCSEIPDLVQSFKKGNFTYYKSAKYESFWTDSETGSLRGFVDISEVSFDSIAYTARYCLKKQQGEMKKDFIDYYESLDPDERPSIRLQPFVGMSLKPGIASEYYEKNKLQIRIEDKVKYHKKYELFSAKPPRYFDKLFDREDPVAFRKVKKKRLYSSLAIRRLQESLYSESYLDRLARLADISKMKENRYYKRGL